jgi:serine/threonine protein kinase
MRVPGYELNSEIARGGMGIVYRAQQLEPPRTVALKMLLPHQLGVAGMAERFRLEVRTLTELEHPAILPVYQAGEYEELPFFTMKLATGGTLAQRRKQLAGEWRGIAELMARLADAVQFAHEHGVLHRDLKPGNILFDDQDRAYVSDFGLAKLLSGDSDLTPSANFLGTPHYVAPEVATRNARQATIASDVYSLGAILYELLAGRPPFEAEGVPALLRKIVEEEPVTPSTARLNKASPNDNSEMPGIGESPSPLSVASSDAPVPRDLEVICLKCLAKEPARRYASARELSEDLRRWLDGQPILARPVSTGERLWRAAMRNPTLAAVSVLLILTLIVGGALLWRANLRLSQALKKSAAAEAAALANLHSALLSQARSERKNRYDGNPASALELIARAAKIHPTLEARNEAAAALAADTSPKNLLRQLPLGLPAHKFPCTFDISHDDRLLLIGTMDSVELVDLRSRRLVWNTPASGLPWMYVSFHPDGKSFLYSARDFGIVRREFRIQEDSGGAEPIAEVGEPETIGRAYDSTIQSIDSSGKSWVVALDRDPLFIVRMDVWPDGRPENAHTIASGEQMTAISLSPDGRWAASTTWPATDVRLWDAQTGKSTGLLGMPGASLKQFTPDGRWLVVRGPKEFRLWATGTWTPGLAWPVPSGSPISIH